MKLDLKEIISPVILIPIILLTSYYAKIDIFYMIIAFFLFSMLNTIIQTKKKKIDNYLFIYTELVFSLIFIIPLYIILNIPRPIILSLATIALIDIIIQLAYNLQARIDGKDFTRLIRKQIVNSSREVFHPISMQVLKLKNNLKISVIDLTRPNMTTNHTLHYRFLDNKLSKDLIKQQYKEEGIVFFLKTNFKIKEENSSSKKTLVNKEVLRKLKTVDKEISKHIYTAYVHYSSSIKISMEKTYCLENPKEIIKFLKKAKTALSK